MIANDGLELLFTGSALLGTILLLLTTVGDGVRMRVRVRIPVRIARWRLPVSRIHRVDDAALLPMTLGFLALFGLGGLFARAFALDEPRQAIAGVTLGIAGAAFAFSSYAFFHRAQAREPTALRALVGRRAYVTVSIDPAARGAVRLVYDGAVQTLPAVSAVRIARGHDVLIDGVRGLAVAVSEIPPPV